MELAEPTRDGDRQIHLLTNLPPEHVGAQKLASIFATRWTVEGMFQELGLAYRGMRIALPAEHWTGFQELGPESMGQSLLQMAAYVRLEPLRRHRRGPKKPRPKRAYLPQPPRPKRISLRPACWLRRKLSGHLERAGINKSTVSRRLASAMQSVREQTVRILRTELGWKEEEITSLLALIGSQLAGGRSALFGSLVMKPLNGDPQGIAAASTVDSSSAPDAL